ncbi:putative membrane protein YvaC [Luteimicrobium xylanilyticum]|uniref:Putative membrane protein YvaC n=1 Tax=Luteimicrobium xylanilyticum TaxID=1133546 RepID=A0A5P9Q815_9MICO|nr:FUSC family protein [Luteimicrobium xylanilyticum]QFU97564.1 putative membrane protein YvaC [Luteimicrobium xylanilyticum]
MTLAPTRPADRTSRTVSPPTARATARHHLQRTWQATLTVNPGNGRADLGVALRAGLTVLAALALLAAIGHRELAGFAALGAIVAVYGRLADPVARLTVVGGAGVLQVATMALASGTGWLVASTGSATLEAWTVPVALGLIAALACAGTAWFRTGPPGPTLVVFAAAGGLTAPATVGGIGARSLATATGVVLALLVAAIPAVRAVARRVQERSPLLPAHPPVPAWHAEALRTGVGSLVGAVVAQSVGLGHPGWAAVGATAVLQGVSRSHMVVRALHRGAGTAAGAVLAWLVLDAHLSFWVLALVVAALQVVTELIVVRNYAVAMLTITPMALLMSSLSGVVDAGTLAADRAVDTLLGVVVGVIVVLVVPFRERPVQAPSTARL